jgi:hypothetical protein
MFPAERLALAAFPFLISAIVAGLFCQSSGETTASPLRADSQLKTEEPGFSGKLFGPVSDFVTDTKEGCVLASAGFGIGEVKGVCIVCTRQA